MSSEPDFAQTETLIITTPDVELSRFEVVHEPLQLQSTTESPQMTSNSATAPSNLLGTSPSEVRQITSPATAQTPVQVSASKSDGHASWQSALISTIASLAIVLTLLSAVRFLLPPLLESARYGWYRGQLRAEHEAASERLNSVNLDGLSQISEAVSMRVTPSVVHVDVRQRNSEPRSSLESLLAGDELVKQYAIGQGSGVIVDADGYILTNHHVLEDADLVEVLLSDRRRLPAEIIGSDPATDLAVLKIQADGLMPIEWGDSDQATVGSSVWAVGSPFGLSGSITFGIISSKHRVDLSGTRYQASNIITPRYGDLLQSDVAVNPGNSGGPLVDYRGSLIGINTAILGESYRGVSFSIPSRVAKRCYEQIRATGSVERGWLGVELQIAQRDFQFMSDVSVDSSSQKESASANVDSSSGAVVMRFAEGKASPALKSGLKIGDRIIEFNGQPIRDSDELIRLIGELDAGTSVPFKVQRGDATLDLNVKLGKRPTQLK